jgi:predicted GH43/DUF377 family glycosyl hydrolase
MAQARSKRVASPQRYGLLMQPRPGLEREEGGVTSPGGAEQMSLGSGPSQFYLYPTLIDAGAAARIGLCQVTRHPDGRPAGVRRLGLALPWSGVRDARVTYVPLCGQYVMAYTTLDGPVPRIALAFSPDGREWTSGTPVEFVPETGAPPLCRCANGHAVFLPWPLRAPDGRRAWGLIHSPRPDGIGTAPAEIWISYLPIQGTGLPTVIFEQHTLLAAAREDWEMDGLGAGCLLGSSAGDILFYWGDRRGPTGRSLISVGALRLDTRTGLPWARSHRPLLSPQALYERGTKEDGHPARHGSVMPAAAQWRDGGIDLYYSADGRAVASCHIAAADLHHLGDPLPRR